MRAHHHPDQARDGEDRPEDETRDRRLLDTRKPQVGVMAQGKHRGREQDNGYFCAGTSPKEFAEAFEQVPSENGFFSEARADNHREQYSGACSGKFGASLVMVVFFSRLSLMWAAHRRLGFKINYTPFG